MMLITLKVPHKSTSNLQTFLTPKKSRPIPIRNHLLKLLKKKIKNKSVLPFKSIPPSIRRLITFKQIGEKNNHKLEGAPLLNKLRLESSRKRITNIVTNMSHTKNRLISKRKVSRNIDISSALHNAINNFTIEYTLPKVYASHVFTNKKKLHSKIKSLVPLNKVQIVPKIKKPCINRNKPFIKSSYTSIKKTTKALLSFKKIDPNKEVHIVIPSVVHKDENEGLSEYESSGVTRLLLIEN